MVWQRDTTLDRGELGTREEDGEQWERASCDVEGVGTVLRDMGRGCGKYLVASTVSSLLTWRIKRISSILIRNLGKIKHH